MTGKLQEYRRLAETAQRQLTGNLERWQSFLTTASRLYKYPYHEQVMIHVQRPGATACAEYDVWNNTMRRYVRRGAKGIALIDIRSDLNRLRYVFDISDTGARENSRSVNLWQLRDEHLPQCPPCWKPAMRFRRTPILARSWNRSPRSSCGNIGKKIKGIFSTHLQIPFWKAMMNSTPGEPFEMPHRPASATA